jgi:phthalate 4,5-dioxygenase
MASAIESDELTRVSPGTIMGDLMRQYWIPAAKSSEVKAGGEPLKLMLLGEKLIAFRDEITGRVGVMDQRCPHRCASLFLGRNEAGGLRCIYHGWKFDVDGNCLEMPNVAPAQRFEDKVKAKAYKVNERGGLIWVYMGARAEAPPMPMIEATLLPEDEVSAQFVQRECNWMQALEGDIDTSHFSFLHIGSVTADQVPEDSMLKYQVACRSPEYHVADTEWGTMYAAYRPTEDEKRIYWRFAQFGFPFWAQVPQGSIIDRVSARAWVPMDDHHTMSVTLNWTKMSRATSSLKDGKPIPGAQPQLDMLPNENEWYGRFRPKANDRNNYFIDREAQRNGTIYSGITHIHMQDQAVTESMGPITDHDFEHLAPSDQMIARTRRRLVHAARALREKGTVPPAVDNPEVFLRARSGECVVATSDWREAYAAKLQEVVRPVYAVAAE